MKVKKTISQNKHIIDKNDWFLDYDGTDIRFNTEEKIKHNLEYDLLTTDWILSKVRESESYAQNLYAAMCNNQFQKLELIHVLKDESCSYSWRRSGGIIADMRQEGDYMDWYCSGMFGSYDQEIPKDYVSESDVTEEIREDLKKLGWRVL